MIDESAVVILEASPWLALVVLLLASTVAWSRWPQTAALIHQRRG